MKKHTKACYSALALIGAAMLAVFGIIQERSLAKPRGNRVQITLLCVSGFSWDRVIPLHRGGRLPFLAQLFRGSGSYGDSISYTPDTDPAIVASLFTGRFPAKHTIYREEDFPKFLARESFQTPVWQELINSGQPCMVVGLPFLQNQESTGSISVQPQESTKNTVTKITREYLQRIMHGKQVPAELLPLLQECVSSDLERMQQAVTARAVRSGLHLFAYFQGLGRWQQLTENADTVPKKIRDELIDNYYIFFDHILAQLFSQCTSNGVFMVLSERGNINGRPRYADHIPHPRSYPAIGFFYATGRYIRAGIEPLTIAPADVVPTLLCLAGIPAAKPLDGRATFNLLEEHFYFKRKIITDTQ